MVLRRLIMNNRDAFLTTLLISGVALTLMWGTIIGYYPNDAESQQVGYFIGGIVTLILPIVLFAVCKGALDK